jgi:hypothetical protein
MIDYKKIKDELDNVGCGFCLAKWTQVTMHLHNGMTHSCHHPTAHKIPLSELNRNPTALHNTLYKKKRRKEMLDGKRPKECDYCWSVEDNSEMNSDRIFKSSEPWSYPFIGEISKLDWRADYNPKYVEVSFSNTCNFKCSYCGPMFSSKWVEEIEKHGEYPTSTKFNDIEWIKSQDQLPYKHSEVNPYVDAFWKWWPELYYDLNTFRITGGEPLLSKDTWGVLDYIITNPNPNKELKLGINSNLGVPQNLIDKLIEKLKVITENGLVKNVVLFTSIDGWGEQAEYIRHGLEFNRFWDNINKILKEVPQLFITFMSTYNALSVTSYHELLKNILVLKEEHKGIRGWLPCMLDTSYLRYPTHQSVRILDDGFKNQILKQAQFATYNLKNDDSNILENGFLDGEVQKLVRTYDWSITEDPDLKINQTDFIKFIDEHDRRRGTNFIKTFPEMEEFYNKIKENI